MEVGTALPRDSGGLEEGWDLRAELWGCPFPTGLSPDLQSMEQIRRIMRPTDVPDQGLLCDLLWSDPDKDVQGWGEKTVGSPSPSGLRSWPNSCTSTTWTSSAGHTRYHRDPPNIGDTWEGGVWVSSECQVVLPRVFPC